MSELDAYRSKKPKNVGHLIALEFYHPSIGVYRFVGPEGVYKEKELGIEAGAPRNAGEMVAHRPAVFSAPFPRVEGEPTVTIQITMARVGSELKSALKKITGFAAMTPTAVIWRYYLTSDLTAPQVEYYLYGEVSLSADAVAITATEKNPLTWRICDINTTQRFPGLLDL